MISICVCISLIFFGIIICDEFQNNAKNETDGNNMSAANVKAEESDIVDVKLFYETFCPDCINFERDHFENVINLLSPHLFIHTYPYGKVKTNVTNGEVTLECQHGSKECYGNTLHACALNHLTNHTEALLFNICMMGLNRSDDATADKCAREMNINKLPILCCAKGRQGSELIRYYGEETKKVNLGTVPHVLINGIHWNGTDFMQDLCNSFKNPPLACTNNLKLN